AEKTGLQFTSGTRKKPRGKFNLFATRLPINLLSSPNTTEGSFFIGAVMTLLASVASLFCSLSLHSAAPAVAVVPAETINRVEIISPIVETDAATDSESLAAADPGDSVALADVQDETAEFTP